MVNTAVGGELIHISALGPQDFGHHSPDRISEAIVSESLSVADATTLQLKPLHTFS